MKHAVRLAGVILVALILAAERPKHIRRLLDVIPLSPPELGADTLIRLAESDKVLDSKWRIEMLEEAFHLADSAKYPVQLAAAVGDARQVDSDAGVQAEALKEKLDALSLRCRVVRTMLLLDRSKALELFREIRAPQFQPLSCEDSLRYSPDILYTTLREVVEQGFSPEAVRKGKHIELCDEHLRRIVSPTQLQPALRMLGRLDVGLAGFAQLMGAIVSNLETMSVDDRTFSSVTVGLARDVLGMAQLSQRNQCSPAPLVNAWRGYLTRHLTGVRCAEGETSREFAQGISRIVESFNKDLLPFSPSTPAIRLEGLKPSKILGHAKVVTFWETSDAQNVMQAYKQLRFGNQDGHTEDNREARDADETAHILTEQERTTPEWRNEAQDFLNQLERWRKNHSDSDRAHFHEICIMYLGLLQIIPPGPVRQNVLESYIAVMKDSSIKYESPPEWYLQVKSLLHGLTGVSAGNHAKMLSDIHDRGDAVLALYVDLETLLNGDVAK